ncbi:hypothetical protein SDC9_191039 [bioreactor metagenome]|uniref:Uncharacterized protein n=1 Tax=bioreactor metagenome TaxID=1076179 RepID=A0A645HZ62_9ZZZZ
MLQRHPAVRLAGDTPAAAVALQVDGEDRRHGGKNDGAAGWPPDAVDLQSADGQATAADRLAGRLPAPVRGHQQASAVGIDLPGPRLRLATRVTGGARRLRVQGLGCRLLGGARRIGQGQRDAAGQDGDDG